MGKTERQNRKKRQRVFTMVICGMIFVSSFGMFLYTRDQYRESKDENSEAAELAGVPSVADISDNETPAAAPVQDNSAERIEAINQAQEEQGSEEVPGGKRLASLKGDAQAAALAETDLTALREVNEDVTGWICIPDTLVNYPIMHGEDNLFYLEHTWKGKANAGGSIFLECKCSPDFTDFNTIIYGHRMSNTTMFGALASYKKQAFYEEHRSVYLVLDGVVRKYDIFASYEPKVTDCTYWVSYSAEKYKRQVIDFAIEKSVIKTGIVPDTDDSIITLSTCTGNGHATRWVVQAVLTGEMKTAESPDGLRPENAE